MPATAILSNASQIVGNIMDEMPHDNQKSVKNYQKVLCVTTTPDHEKQSQELLQMLIDLKSTILNDVEITEENIKLLLEVVNGTMLQGIQRILDKIQYFFAEGFVIKIDDDNMINSMNNYSEAKETLVFISDYLHLVNEVKKSKQDILDEHYKVFSFDELVDHLNAA